MPKVSWGDAPKKRAKFLLKVLLFSSEEKKREQKVECQWCGKENEYLLFVKAKLIHLERLLTTYSKENNEEASIQLFLKNNNNGQFDKEKIRQAINQMREINIVEDKREPSNNNEKKGGVFLWEFNLKLWYGESNKNQNLKKFCKHWDKEKPAKKTAPETYKNQSTNENIDPEKRIRKAADFLRSFDCVQQESISKPKIVNDKMGIFSTTVEKELELWFRWRLTKCMGDFEKIKKITINIDFSIAHDFNQFWHKFGKYIGEKNNLNRKKVIDELVELCETQPVLIIINNVTNLYLKKQPLASSEENIFNFFYHLFNSFRSNKNKSYKSYLVVFLIEGKKKSQNINQEYSNQINNYSPKEDIIELQFTDFLQEDIESWLTENERKLGEEGFCANIEPGKMDYLSQQDSITLLNEVCQQVFNLESILDVEHYWKNIA